MINADQKTNFDTSIECLKAALLSLPGVGDALTKVATDGDLYRVRASSESIHLLREGADGFTKPFLRGIVENVNLERIPPETWNAMASLAMAAMLQDLSRKMDFTIRNIDNRTAHVTTGNRGELVGAIGSIKTACQFEGPNRTAQLSSSINIANPIMGRMLNQLNEHMMEMPQPEASLWVGLRENRVKAADPAWPNVRDDLEVIAYALPEIGLSWQRQWPTRTHCLRPPSITVELWEATAPAPAHIELAKKRFNGSVNLVPDNTACSGHVHGTNTTWVLKVSQHPVKPAVFVGQTDGGRCRD